MRHYRQSAEDSSKVNELAPIDQNLNYNVDYQVSPIAFTSVPGGPPNSQGFQRFF